MNKIIPFLMIICFGNLYPQTDWVRWEKKEIRYTTNKEIQERDYSFYGANLSETILNSFSSAYWFLISDLDGDNCPFRPSCSNFFVQAVRETNLPQGVFMFFDRFTRDLNIFNRTSKYPRLGSIHYYDPISLYTLDESKIHYLPPHTFIKSE